MDLRDLQTLLDYHYWARDKVLDAAAALSAEQFTRDLGSSFKSVRDTLAHIYSSEYTWYARWQGDSPTAHLSNDQFPDVEPLRQAWLAHEARMRNFLEQLGDAGISRVFEYKLFNGQPGSSPFWQMLQHVVNHGSYHRGQVTTMLRQMGALPPKGGMDMIGFYRSQVR
jgi:uncharacterized damage-inducible protein DinB